MVDFIHICTNCIVDWLLQNGSNCIPCSGKLLNTVVLNIERFMLLNSLSL